MDKRNHQPNDLEAVLRIIRQQTRSVFAGLRGKLGIKKTKPQKAKPVVKPTPLEKDHQEPEKREGPFGIILDFHERKASRGRSSVTFGGRDIPWKVFVALCKRYPQHFEAKDLIDKV